MILQPIHNALYSDLIDPKTAGDQIAKITQDFLLSKPEFESSSNEQYKSHPSKLVEKAKSVKNSYRKSMKDSDNEADRQLFYDALRAHNKLLKNKRSKDKSKTVSHQEKLFRQNFWDFSKKVTNGQYGLEPTLPAFTKEAADKYFSPKYSTATPVDVASLSWFPDLPQAQVPFNMDPVRPRDIRATIQAKSSGSSPGPDGISYAVLKKLPCLHHILATQYSKLLTMPDPPLSWSTSKITLIYKKNDPSIPQNFRMIALSSTLGKTFHQIIAKRLVEYFTQNGYIDKTVQKAFINRINGVIEHNQTLHEIIKHSKANKKTVHMTFFDLEDAFGSVQHNLISHSLKRFCVPTEVQNYIMTLYSRLDGTVITPNWSSHSFQFKKGVFQGDPLSPVIFLAVFNPILEALNNESQAGYDLNGRKISTTPFADDFNLITSNKRVHQKLVTKIHNWTSSMGLKLKPSKCVSLSICSGKPTPVYYKIGDDEVVTLKEGPHKFLGSNLTFSGNQSDIFQLVHGYFETRLKRIDDLYIREEYKVKMFRDYVIPSSRFMLTVHEVTSTNLDKLDSLCNRFLKKVDTFAPISSPRNAENPWPHPYPVNQTDLLRVSSVI